ncbi:hypothetical protein EBZ39_11620 [bacterium]|nr:hypothetical protein [bacterium]
MALDLKFAESVLNLNHRVLGKRLKPFSLWHALLLEAIGSPIWLGKGTLTLPDLHAAVAICSNEWPVFNLRAGFFTVLRNSCISPSRLQIEGKKLVAYFNDYNAVPMLWTEEKKDSKDRPKCPLPLSLDLVAWLVRHGFGEARSWNMPIGLAHWYYIACARQRGGEIDLVSPEEQAVIEQVKARKNAAAG